MRQLSTRRQVDDWKDGKDIVPQEKETRQFVRKNREGRKHRTDRCMDLGGEIRVHEMCKEKQEGEHFGVLAVASSRMGEDIL